MKHKPLNIFKKDDAEKSRLRLIKREHKAGLLKLGLNPKKVMNIPFNK